VTTPEASAHPARTDPAENFCTAAPRPSSSTEENWRTVRALLCDRIGRRWLALARLSPDAHQVDVLEAQLAAIGDDGRALWQLAERLDRALDVAFAPRARRVAANDPLAHAPTKSHADEFKVR